MSNSLESASKWTWVHFLVASLFLLFVLVGQAHAQCSSPANQIVAENCQVGNDSSEWDVKTQDGGDPTIQGFATDISVNRGSTVFFKINTTARNYTINIYRVGYYGGMGARKVATITPSVTLPQTQPACISDANTGLVDCGNWAVSASWPIPATATSGVYFAHLVRTDTGGDSHIVFVVRNDSSHSAILYQTSDETWQAYNYYGNGSLYGQASPAFNLTGRSFKVSYNRPFLTRGFGPEWDTWLFGPEFPMIQWLEQNGYDVTYFTGVDGARNGSLIQNHKIFMDSGHDEYWSGPRRANVQAARDAGVNLAFFSGNTSFWKTRWENSIDGANTPNRTLVCYKETLSFGILDPSDPPTSTGTWRDPTYGPPSDGYKPENALTGSLFMINGPGPENNGSLTMKVPWDDGKMRFWRNTAVASLASNSSYTLPPGSLGYEWDLDVDNGFRPAGAFHLSTSTYSVTSDLLLDYGATYGAGQGTHHLMLYRAPSGALVFSAGTINWSWGLNSNHDNLWGYPTPAPDPNMQQATVNLFADMGVQPGSLQSGLVAASASTDTTPPVSRITSPTSNSTIHTGGSVTVTGTATDSGGMVGGVELSGDGGQTWHPATGRSSWSASWTPTVVGSVNFMSRAVDDSGNKETPSSGVTVNVTPQNCPCTVWNSSSVPVSADSGDATPVEVGFKFRADSDGSALGVRFYKSAQNTGTHVGHIWSSTGALLGTATFAGESSSGWQQANFTTPVPVVANSTYIVSYYAPTGHYAGDTDFFAQSGVDTPPLHALASGVDGPNGVYATGPSGTFPNSTFRATNYWVDVVYTSSNTYNVSGAILGPGGSGATLSLSGPGTTTTTADGSGNFNFSGQINGTYTLTPTNQGVTFTPASRTITINGGAITGISFTATVTNPLSISGVVSGSTGVTVKLGGKGTATTTTDGSGNYAFSGLLAGAYTVTPVKGSFVFTPGTQAVTLSNTNATGVNFQGQFCNCGSIWQASATPVQMDGNDGTPIEVGVKFRVDSPGTITGIKFYKASTNVGTHIGHIWSSTGVLLGSATFTNETASGWQQVNFATPIQVTSNTTYVASYFAPSGRYSVDLNYFATNGVDSSPLHALANGVDGPNGLYIYTSSSGFPTNSYLSSNYWVDVLYSAAQTASISGTISGAAGAGSTVTLSGASSATTIADASGNYTFSNVLSGSYSVTPSKAGVIFVPGNQNVSAAGTNIAGVNFNVPQICPCNTIWPVTSLPTLIDSGDGSSYELGTKFRADADGYVIGVRFYKGAANTGTHIGNLWSNAGTGTLLSTATFSNESASGWQQVTFANPVPITANTTYIASYFAPVGHYSVDPGAFASTGIDSPPLHALANGIDGANGIFTNATVSVFPNNSYNSSNYWVDVIYAKATTHTLAGVVTGPGAAGATLTLSGAGTASITSDSSGGYSFSGLADGTYTVTPTKVGFSFIPSSQTITISGSHNLTVNFASSQPTYVVSGAISGGTAGITISLTGTISATVATDASGNFIFPSVPNGSYTVTPTGLGYAVTPATQNITVNGANVGAVNFTAAALSYSISGTISGGGGTTVNLSGAINATTTADSSGNYSFSGITNGSYTITPVKSGLVFTPAILTAVVTGANVIGANFATPASCPCVTIWPSTITPAIVDSGDNQAIEIGVKFRSESNGYISGIRFYKGPTNTGTHLGHLWSSSGTLLATATFTNETGSGWQQVFFDNPVPIVANTTYVASYFAPGGDYSVNSGYFGNSGVDSVPLHALANGVDGLNGVFLYGPNGGFPTNSYNSGNYWVDVIYIGSYSITGTINGAGAAGMTVTLSGTSSASTTTDASGTYNFAGLTNGNYTITPSNSGFVFAPATQNVTVAGSNLTVPAFTASAQTFTITGTITGPGGSGATVTLGGAATATTTANASGVYTLTGVTNGSYTVTPSKTGFVFTPTSQAVTVSGANATANFGSAAQTFTITGTITGAGGAGATVSLSGGATATTTADALGFYTFSGVTNGSYTATPVKAGFVFTPASQAVTVNGANATANFTSTAVFTITGTISGAGGSGATVNLTGASTATVTANASGVYTFTGIKNGSYTVTPAKTGFVFTPASQAVTVNGANATANFTSTAVFTITGTISGAGGSGATVNLTGASTATVTASTSGVYTFTGIKNGSYTVTPAKTGFAFTPVNQAVTVNGANATANFSSAPVFTISGTISGAGGPGATVKLSGAGTVTVTANSSGAYTFTGVTAGSYTVTPSKTGYRYAPGTRPTTVTTGNVTGLNFNSF